jgi:K+-sensing histidine kinase KdpD
MQNPLNVALGTVLSAILALLASVLCSRSNLRGLLPLAFMAVVLVLARRFGVTVSLTGSIAAAIVFAITLFAPARSIRIVDADARMSLGWMILGSVALSYLLYPSRPNPHDRNRN